VGLITFPIRNNHLGHQMVVFWLSLAIIRAVTIYGQEVKKWE